MLAHVRAGFRTHMSCSFMEIHTVENLDGLTNIQVYYVDVSCAHVLDSTLWPVLKHIMREEAAALDRSAAAFLSEWTSKYI